MENFKISLSEAYLRKQTTVNTWVINIINSRLQQFLLCISASPGTISSVAYFCGPVIAHSLNSAHFRFHKVLVTHWAVNFDLCVSQRANIIAARWQIHDGGKQLKGRCCGRDGQRDFSIVCSACGGFYCKGNLDLWVIKALSVLLTLCAQFQTKWKGPPKQLCSTTRWRNTFTCAALGTRAQGILPQRPPPQPSPSLARKPPAATKVTAGVTVLMLFTSWDLTPVWSHSILFGVLWKLCVAGCWPGWPRIELPQIAEAVPALSTHSTRTDPPPLVIANPSPFLRVCLTSANQKRCVRHSSPMSGTGKGSQGTARISFRYSWISYK